MTSLRGTLAIVGISSTLFFALLGSAPAAPPWSALIPFRRVDADPNNRYYLTVENGPWMVLAASFSGAGAEQQAHDLVLELRGRYKLQAYVHKKHYDYTDEVEGLGWDKYGVQKKMRHVQSAEFDAVAVMVGNYPSVDDSDAQEALDEIKYATPECLDISKNKSSTQRFAGLREFQKRFFSDKEKRQMGPMRMAFLTRNPLIPKEQFELGGLDKFVLSMNDGVQHSLLDCPGKYSVKIATFRGVVTQDPKTIERFQSGAKLPSKLAEAAEYAHQLTMALRKMNIDAYEFHDRYESVVTVGSFDWVANPSPDGRDQMNPAVHQVIEKFKAQPKRLPGKAAAELQPRIIAGAPCDIQPVPIMVPGKTASSAFRTVGHTNR